MVNVGQLFKATFHSLRRMVQFVFNLLIRLRRILICSFIPQVKTRGYSY